MLTVCRLLCRKNNILKFQEKLGLLLFMFFLLLLKTTERIQLTFISELQVTLNQIPLGISSKKIFKMWVQKQTIFDLS